MPLEKLLIEPGKAAFVVYLDVVCLNYDGGVLDAAVLACAGALRKRESPIYLASPSIFRLLTPLLVLIVVLPEANYDIDTGRTLCEQISPSHPGTPLAPLLGLAPVAVSFGVFNG